MVKTQSNCSRWGTQVRPYNHVFDVGSLGLTRTNEACLLGAIQMVAGRTGKKDMAKDAVVRASVHLGKFCYIMSDRVVYEYSLVFQESLKRLVGLASRSTWSSRVSTKSCSRLLMRHASILSLSRVKR